MSANTSKVSDRKIYQTRSHTSFLAFGLNYALYLKLKSGNFGGYPGLVKKSTGIFALGMMICKYIHFSAACGWKAINYYAVVSNIPPCDLGM